MLAYVPIANRLNALILYQLDSNEERALYLRQVTSRFFAALAPQTAQHDTDNVSYEPHPDSEQ
jgi:hypothetical protein